MSTWVNDEQSTSRAGGWGMRVLNVVFPLFLLPLVVGVLWSGRLADEPFMPWATLAGGSAAALAVLMLVGWWAERPRTPSIPPVWEHRLELVMVGLGFGGWFGLEALLALGVAHGIR
ncbi:hypothetical protein [Streptomyces justiciae]|uniref:hypothetical protein n=1 Tax=Streptomyces justiciae TaxID=2780140 RepID=UPI002119AD22|nr:hypothetical protein [Streptomyces justiciae]MCW8383976.1 hypothetical protein [Streptomyces justiciae]